MIYAYLAVIRLDDLGASVFTKFILAQVWRCFFSSFFVFLLARFVSWCFPRCRGLHHPVPLTTLQDAQKMNVFLGFIFNEQTLNKWLKDEWCELVSARSIPRLALHRAFSLNDTI
jgi:hypothetical protein